MSASDKIFWSLKAQRSFLSKIKRSDGCWEWQAACDKGGYGRFTLNLNGPTRRTVRVFAHRAIYDMLKGSVPANMQVCHTCDNPPCCNPDHLFLGTPADNMADKIAKGRAACGAIMRTNSKLTEEVVREIRSLHGAVMQKDLAHRFGVSKQTISKIVLRQHWKHVA